MMLRGLVAGVLVALDVSGVGPLPPGWVAACVGDSLVRAESVAAVPLPELCRLRALRCCFCARTATVCETAWRISSASAADRMPVKREDRGTNDEYDGFKIYRWVTYRGFEPTYLVRRT